MNIGGVASFVRVGNRSAGRKNAAAAHRHPNAARRHSGRRASSSASAAFYPTSIGLLRIVSKRPNDAPPVLVNKPH
jgi:hypothetical protein